MRCGKIEDRCEASDKENLMLGGDEIDARVLTRKLSVD